MANNICNLRSVWKNIIKVDGMWIRTYMVDRLLSVHSFFVALVIDDGHSFLPGVQTETPKASEELE